MCGLNCVHAQHTIIIITLSKVHVVVDEGWTLKAVGGGTSSLHAIGHSRWSTREDTNLGKENVLLLEVVKELVEVRTTKVGGTTKTSEQVFTRKFLEAILTDIL